MNKNLTITLTHISRNKNFCFVRKFSGLVLYIHKPLLTVFDSPNFVKATELDVMDFNLKSYANKDNLPFGLNGNIFFLKKFSGMVLYVNYSGCYGRGYRKATEIEIAALDIK